VHCDIVSGGNVVKSDHSGAIFIKNGVGHHNHVASARVHGSADSGEELIEGDSTVVVLVEVFEDALELRGAEFVAVLAETPHEFITVKFLVTVIVHAFENGSESTDTVRATGVQSVSNFLENLVWGFARSAERGVNVRVVTTSADGEHGAKLLVVESAIAVLIELAEASVHLVGSESASESFKSFSEFANFDSSVTVQIEVFENFLDSSAFIIGSVGALTDLLEDDVKHFGAACWAYSSLVGVEAPYFEDQVDEVVLLLAGHDGIDLTVVSAEVVTRNTAVVGSLSHDSDKVVENGFSLLLTGSDSRVSGGVILFNELFESAGISTFSNLLPGKLDDSEALGAHVGLHDVDELRVSDLTVLVEIEVVVDGSQFLAGKEDSELGEEFFELKLGKSAVLVLVELKEDSLELF